MMPDKTVLLDIPRPAPDLVARYKAVRLDAVARALSNAALADPAIKPAGPSVVTMAGAAVTLSTDVPDTAYAIAALGAVQAGDVLMIAPGPGVAAAWGGGLTNSADILGLAGVGVDGLIVDSDAVRACVTPVFCRGASFRGGPAASTCAINATILWGGVSVSPGDLVLGDGDGVCVVPLARVAELIDAAESESARIEAALAEMHANRQTLFDRRGGAAFARSLGLDWPGDPA
jgi:4-hydroxy-4-methyl-2-oxoglutarate aldolase